MQSAGFKISIFLLLFFIGLVVGVTIFGNKGWLAYHHLTQAKAQMQRSTADLKIKNHQLASEIYRLKHDKDYLERVVRQQLNMGKPDELVFKFR